MDHPGGPARESRPITEIQAADVAAIVDRVRNELPPESWPAWPGGWPGSIEAAVLDSVFSIRARYGSPSTGVRAVVARWSTHRHGELNDLRHLAAFVDRPTELAELLANRQVLSGGLTKAAGAAAAADALVTIGVRHAADIPANDGALAAWCSIKGLSLDPPIDLCHAEHRYGPGRVREFTTAASRLIVDVASGEHLELESTSMRGRVGKMTVEVARLLADPAAS